MRTATSISLENIANGDMLYHNADHTIMVASVGSEIIRGKHWNEGGFLRRGGTAFLLARATVARRTRPRSLPQRRPQVESRGWKSANGSKCLPPALRALLSPFHVGRSQVFVREHFYHQNLVDLELVCSCIERTQFPVPRGKRHQRTSDLPGLTRAADLIGQLRDPEYLRKIPAFF